MKLRTKTFSFTKPIYFQILSKNTLKRNWWMLAMIGAFAGYQVTKAQWETALWIGLSAVVFFAFLMYRCWRHANRKTNPLFYADRHFEVDNQLLNCKFKNGALNQIKLADIRRVIKTPGHYELYLNKKSFIFLPLQAFQSAQDITAFESILRGRFKK